MKSCQTFEAKIYLGLTEGYDGNLHHLCEVHTTCQPYLDEIGLCITMTPTEFRYTKGFEKGVIIGLINYPRFESTAYEIKENAIHLAQILMKRFNQNRVSIVFTDETIMLEQEDTYDIG